MSSTKSFDQFRPLLRKGRLVPKGKVLIFETFEPFNQIVLPIEMADLMSLSNGHYSLREIIDKIYRRQGYLHFRTLCTSVYKLRNEGFFENGDELSLQEPLFITSAKMNRRFRWGLKLPLIRRVENDFKSETLFYLFSMICIVWSLVSLAVNKHELNASTLFYRDGSAFIGLMSLWLSLSLFLSIRTVIKSLLLLSLTGRYYNLSFKVMPWGCYLDVGSESQSLIQNRLYLFLFHLTMFISPLTIISCMSFFQNDLLHGQGSMVAVALMFWNLNPYGSSQFVQYLKDTFENEGRGNILNLFQSDSILRTLHPSVDKKSKQYIIGSQWFHFTWTLCMLIGISWLLNSSDSFDLFSQGSISPQESAARLFIVVLLLGGWVYNMIYLSKVIHYTLISPFLSLILQTRQFHRIRFIMAKKMDQHEIFYRLQGLPLFNSLSDNFLRTLIEDSEILHCQAKSYLFHHREKTSDLYVLLSGEIELSRPTPDGPQTISVLRPTTLLGEAAIMEGELNASDAICKTSALALRVPVQTIQRIFSENRFSENFTPFRDAILVSQFFHFAPMFRELPKDVAETLIHRGKIQTYLSGELIFEQGSWDRSFYMILRGSVDVYVDERYVRTLHAGSFFGEISVIASIPRTARVMASESTILLGVQADAFWDVMVLNIELALFIEAIGERRLRERITMSQTEISALQGVKKSTGTGSTGPGAA